MGRMKDLEVVMKSVDPELQLGFLIDKLIDRAHEELGERKYHRSARCVKAVSLLQEALGILNGTKTPEDLDQTALYMERRVRESSKAE
jgi:hypothetical protein